MSDLVAVSFGDMYEAEQLRLDLLKLQHEHLVDLEEAVVAVRNHEGKVKLHHASHMTFPGAVGGGIAGTLGGFMLFNPVLAVIGLIVGTAIGALAGGVLEVGIDEKFIKDLADHLKPGSSALFILVKKGNSETIRKELEKFHGKILQTSLSPDDEKKLHEKIDAIKRGSM